VTQTVEAEVNGAVRRLVSGISVARLVAEVAPEDAAPGVAVAVNGEVVPRPRWPERKIQHGDVIEIVRAVQGG
jgi:sulfur carrier protein